MHYFPHWVGESILWLSLISHTTKERRTALWSPQTSLSLERDCYFYTANACSILNGNPQGNKASQFSLPDKSCESEYAWKCPSRVTSYKMPLASLCLSGASLFCELFPLLLKTVPMSHRKKQTNKQTNVSMRSESVKEYVLTRTTDFLLKKKEKKSRCQNPNLRSFIARFGYLLSVLCTALSIQVTVHQY